MSDGPPPSDEMVVVHEHPVDGALREDRIPHIWCPGCGLGPATNCYTRAMEIVDIPRELQVVVSGIGCSGRVAGYVDIDSYHTTHGRAIPFATGIKLAKPELLVTVFSGDGDLFTIGGNHVIHAARRNIDINVICNNNFIYGMTGGQMAATTPHEARSTTSPMGNFEYPFNLPHIMAALGATYVSRWTALHVRQLTDAIIGAMNHPGFSFIEIISPCPVGYGKRNEFANGLSQMRYFRERSIVDHNADLADAGIDFAHGKPVVVGNFLCQDRLSYHEVKEHMLAQQGIKRPRMPRFREAGA